LRANGPLCVQMPQKNNQAPPIPVHTSPISPTISMHPSCPAPTTKTKKSTSLNQSPTTDPLAIRHPKNRLIAFKFAKRLIARYPYLDLRSIFQNILRLQTLLDPTSVRDILRLTLEAEALIEYYFNKRPASRYSNLKWSDLGQLGRHQLSASIIEDHSMPRLPRVGALPYQRPPPRPIPCSDPIVKDFVRYALSNELIVPCDKPINSSLFFIPKPASNKVRIIADLRPFNHDSNLEPLPMSFPDFSTLKSLLSHDGCPRYFAKLDISNCYWSMILPEHLQSSFVFRTTFHKASFALRSLPFGWNLSPRIASKTLQSLLPPTTDQCHRCQFIDDILFSSCDFDSTNLNMQAASRAFTQANLHIAAKSSKHPTTEIIWLGKSISSTPKPSIANTEAVRLQSFAKWLLLASHKRVTKLDAMKFAGYLTWVGIHTRLHLPYMSPIHRASHARPSYALSAREKAALLYATVVANHPWTNCDIVWEPPIINTPLCFCDATVNHGALVIPDRNITIKWKIPKHAAANQQCAELWTCCQSIKFINAHHLPHALGSDSSSSLYSMVHLRTPAYNEARAKLLRSLSTAIRNLNQTLHVFWISTESNVADGPSRSFTYQPAGQAPSHLHTFKEKLLQRTDLIFDILSAQNLQVVQSPKDPTSNIQAH
jgi:hypothetical protein